MKLPSADELPPIEYEAYYDDETKNFWIRAPSGAYLRCDRSHLKSKLRQLGFNHTAEDGGLPEVDIQLLNIVDHQHLRYAGPLAGHFAGPFDTRQGKILVTSSPCPVEPDSTVEWNDLEAYIHGLLGPQDVYLYSWLKIGYESLRSGKFRPGQIMALAGDTGSGKSLLQSLLTEFFGREAKPFRYLSGGTTFNGEMFEAEHLVIGDEAAGTDIRTRRHFGKELKQIASEVIHSCHKKRQDALALRPFWRCSISLNVDGENIMVLPPMDESMKDKMMLLKCSRSEFLASMGSDIWTNGFKEKCIAQLPGLAAWLLSVDIPAEVQDQRWGVRAYQHPDLLAMLGEHSPEERLWDLILEVLFSGQEEEHVCTAAWLEETLMTGHKGAAKLFSFPTACGVYLSRLSDLQDGRVSRAAARSTWRIVKNPKQQGDG